MQTSSPSNCRRRSAVEPLAVGAALTLAVLLGVSGVAQAQDNQITVWLERESSSVHEGEADGFGIYLSAPPNTLDPVVDASGQFKIPLVATPFGGARRGIDFHGPGTAKFWLDETRTGLGVWTHEDDRVEEGHGVVVTFGTLPDGVILAVGKPTTMTIDFIDGPSGPRVSFDLDPATISENGGTSTISASMNKTADEDVTLTVVADPMDPAVAGDFTLSTNRTLTITAGSRQSTGLVTLTARDNDLDGPDKVILIKGVLSEGTTGVGAPNPGRLVITDDEVESTSIALSVDPTAVSEGAGTTSVTVTGTLNGLPRDTETEVNVSVAGVTATAGTDFATVDSFTLAIPANNRSGTATFDLTPTDDTSQEVAETISVSGTNDNGLTVSAATLNITDNDAPQYTLTVNPTTIDEDAGTTTVTASTGGTTFLEDQTIALSFGGSATKGTDYSVDDETLTLTAGLASVSTTVRATDDVLTDPNETIEITATLDGAQFGAQQTVTITDDETASTRITLTLAPAEVAEDAGETNVTVTGELDGGALSTATDVTVTVAGGTATAGTDFTAVAPFTLTIEANETSGAFTLPFTPTSDTTVEETETVTVSGTNDDGLTVTSATLDITNDDAPVYALSVSVTAIAEADGTSIVTVSTGGVSFLEDQTIALEFGGTATKESDYSVDAESLTLTAGETSVSTTVRAVDDTMTDPDETIEIVAKLDRQQIGDTRTVTIADDETAATRITLSVNPAAVAEDAGATDITVTGTLNGAAQSTAVEIQVSVASGTATADTDFTAVTSFALEIDANETTGTAMFEFTPMNDSLAEETETVKVTGNADGDLTVWATSLDITDDDAPRYTLAVNPASIAESEGTASVTVSTGGVTFSDDQTFTLSFAGSATKGTDYSVDAESLTLTAGQMSVSTTVQAVDDEDDDPNETIEITAALNGETVGTTQTLTITDDDGTRSGSETVEDNEPNDGNDPDDEGSGGGEAPDDGGNDGDEDGDEDGDDDSTKDDETPPAEPNRAPTAVDDRAETAEDTPVLIDVTANDTDPDGDALRVVAVMAPAHGTVTVVAGGLRYVPAPDYNGPDRFTYRVADSDGETAAAAVTVAVVPVNDAPLAVGSIPNQRLEEGGPPATLELAPYFEDADDAVLTYTAASSDPSVTTVTVTGSELTLAAVVTGNAAVTVTAADAGGLTATQTFDVAVGDALVKDVMTDTLAALGRGYLSSVQMTLERRMEARTAQPRAMVAGQPLPLGTADLAAMPLGTMQRWQMATLAAQQRSAASPAARAAAAVVRHAADQAFGSGLGPSLGGGQLLQGTELLLSFGEESPAPSGDRRWTVWGQGDIQTFQGGPIGQANFDGWLRTAYLGLDAQVGRNWLAGVAVARSGGAGDWQTGPAEGRLTTALTAVHPYVRWGDQDTSVWAMMGIGRGTASNVRAADDRRETSSLALGLGLIEARRRLGEIGGGVQLGLRSEASWARLATGAGYESLDALRASVFRGRIGMEATRDTRLGSVTLTPFGALSARQDGGAGQTGTGLELAGGLRLRGGRVRLIAQGRMLALHSAAGYQERGASLTASVGAGPQQRGLALSVTPRWGASASGADTLWQDQFYRYTDGSAPFDQGIDARGSYGLGVADDRLLLVPFAAYGRIADGERLQLGTTLGALGARGGAPPVEFEFSGARYTRRLRGTDHRFSLLGIVTFGGRGGGASCGALAGCGLSGLDLPVTGTAGTPNSAGADETR